MAEIYIGDQQISGGGGTIDTSGFVDVSTWDEHEKVIASALVDLKSLEDKIEEFDESIQAQETALLAEVHVVEQQKADASVVYTKTEIDKSDKVVAAALASLDDRVSTLESSGGSGGGSTPDLTNYIDYTTALNAGLAFSTQRNSIESVKAAEVTGTASIVSGDMSGNFIYLDPVSCDISFSYNGDTGSINLMDLYNFLQNYN